ncbi:MAG TPA: redoxin domain-containing protein [Gemmatimonadaceae bacterium]|jgi:thiol-disulfide isomerase/thioredoxin
MRSWQRPVHALERLAVMDELSSLAGATAWINSPPLTAANLKGKVVLVQFWTFTCINWLRTLPYVRAWAQTYRETGLVVIGAHTPEFSFEHNLENVRRATMEMKVEYPVAVDSDYKIWRGFNNQYWPALYLIDGKGHLRYHHFGEGEYPETERKIQQLLTESGAHESVPASSRIDARGIELPADWANLHSAENYVGYERTEGFASPEGVARGSLRSYTLPRRLGLNQWALDGEWTIANDHIALHKPNGRIAYSFRARDLNLVMGPAAGTRPVRFRALLDGQPAMAAHGGDLDEQGNGVATSQRLYQLIRQPAPIVDRLFQIEYLDAGVEAFAFTFG